MKISDLTLLFEMTDLDPRRKSRRAMKLRRMARRIHVRTLRRIAAREIREQLRES